MLGNEEDFTACLGFEVEGVDDNLTELDTGVVPDDDRSGGGRVPELQGGRHHPARRPQRDGQRLVRDRLVARPGLRRGDAAAADLEILDRVGGGDSFASGLIYGLLERGDLQTAVEYGAAHGALAMTTPGDTSTATLAEVESLVAGGSACVSTAEVRLCTGVILRV